MDEVLENEGTSIAHLFMPPWYGMSFFMFFLSQINSAIKIRKLKLCIL